VVACPFLKAGVEKLEFLNWRISGLHNACVDRFRRAKVIKPKSEIRLYIQLTQSRFLIDFKIQVKPKQQQRILESFLQV
jgi:hypothetical protein